MKYLTAREAALPPSFFPGVGQNVVRALIPLIETRDLVAIGESDGQEHWAYSSLLAESTSSFWGEVEGLEVGVYLFKDDGSARAAGDLLAGQGTSWAEIEANGAGAILT